MGKSDVAGSKTSGAHEKAKQLMQLLQFAPWSKVNCLLWARGQFDKLFNEEIQALLKEHPAGEVDEEGIAFWGG